jgi:glycosyltransferase involved in cell wall biosynthesis
MHVAIISQDFPPASYGGIASSCFDLANALEKHGINVTVFSTAKKVTPKLENGGLNINWFPKYASAPRLSLIFNSSILVSSVEKFKPDVIHSFGPYGPLINKLKKKTKKPVLSNIHGVPYKVFTTFVHSPLSSWTLGDFASNCLEFPVSYFLMKKTLDTSDHVVFPSINCLNDTKLSHSILADKVSVILNGIDFTSEYYSNKDKKSQESSTIVYCGRLTWIKGVLLLIKAFSILAKKNSEVTLLIIGGGSLDSKARALTSELGLSNRIRFLGVLSREKTIEEIRKAAFLVLPSISENCPVVVCEAMSLGKPVLAFNYDFSRALIEDNFSGFLVKPFDLESYAEKMLLLLSDTRLRRNLGHNAYSVAKEKFDWDRNVEGYIALYNKLVDK